MEPRVLLSSQVLSFSNHDGAAITDFGEAVLEIPVSGIVGTIADVNVNLSMQHTYVGDLRIQLELDTPTQSFSVLLFDRQGGGGDDLYPAFDDEATLTLDEGAPPYSGENYRPLNPLSVLDNLDPNGTWRIRVADEAGGDTGQFFSWDLILTVEDIVPPDDGQDPAVDILDVDPDPFDGPVDEITIAFSEPVSGFSLANLSLNDASLGGSFTAQLVTTDNQFFLLKNLSSLTSALGPYTLTLDPLGVQDSLGNPLAEGDSESFDVADLTPPKVQQVTADGNLTISPDPVQSISLSFSEAISDFTLADLTLTYDAHDGSGPVNVLTTDQTLTAASASFWTLDNLAGITAAGGSYELRLGGSVADASGNTLSNVVLASWANGSYEIRNGADELIFTTANPDFASFNFGAQAVDEANSDGNQASFSIVNIGATPFLLNLSPAAYSQDRFGLRWDVLSSFSPFDPLPPGERANFRIQYPVDQTGQFGANLPINGGITSFNITGSVTTYNRPEIAVFNGNDTLNPLSMTPGALVQFTTKRIGQASDTQTFFLVNFGNQDLENVAVSASGGFRVVESSVQNAVIPATTSATDLQYAMVRVQMDTSTAGSKTGQLSITSNDTTDGESPFTLSLSGLVRANNSAPQDITLLNTTLAENAGHNAEVGTLSTTDPDAGNTFTYSLIPIDGSNDHAAFNISGSSLRATSSLNSEAQSSYTVRIRSTDQGGLFTEKDFTVTVTNVNETPTDVALATTTLAENAGDNAQVGTLSTTDPDAGNTFTYTLIPIDDSNDHTAFNISGSTLRATSSLSFEAKSSYTLRIRSTDQGGLSTEKDFTVTLTNVNETPTDITLSNAILAENAAANTTVGTLSTTDPDAGNTFTYTLVPINGSSDHTAFNINGNSLRATSSLNFETKSSYTVRVRSTDQGGLSTEKDFAVTVTNVNETPTNITLSNAILAENAAANTTVGTLSTTDPDPGNTFTYTLVPINGSSDHTAFNLSGSSLRATSSLNFEAKNSYTLRIRSTDQGGLFTEKNFTVTVTDAAEVQELARIGKAGDGRSKTSAGDAFGNLFEFIYKGAGALAVLQSDAGRLSLRVEGSDAKSSLIIKRSASGDGGLDSITASGPLATLTGKGVNLRHELAIAGRVGAVTLGDVISASGQAQVSLGGGTSDKPVKVTLGRLRDVSFQIAAPLSVVTLTDWLDPTGTTDRLTAPKLGKLVTKGSPSSNGDFEADVELSGQHSARRTLDSATLAGTLRGATWRITGHAGAIKTDALASGSDIVVSGDLAGVTTLVGGVVGSAGDNARIVALSIATLKIKTNLTHSLVVAGSVGGGSHSIKTVKIDGQFDNSRLVVGARPGVDGVLGSGDDTFLGGVGQSLKSLTIGGAAEGTAIFRAGALPKSAKIGGVKIKPAEDGRFVLTPV